MVVCKFFASGNCRYGANCRFEHPQNTDGHNSNQNRFGPLSGQNSHANDGSNEQSWAINTADVKSDMTAGQGRPQWILSAYGPGRAPPASLLENNEYSFEELRLRYYELVGAGSEAQANQEAGALWSKAEDGMRGIAQNVDDVIKFMEGQNQKHPNRYDFCQMNGSMIREEHAKAAGSINTGAGGVFQQPTTTPGFGKPSFGQPAASSGFGPSTSSQASQPAQTANPFAKPSAASAFGRPAFGQPAAAAAFGQSGFGQPSVLPSTGFGQPAQQAAFGRPSFGQPAQPAPAFGQPSQSTMSFGQPSQPTSTFGQPSQTAQTANPFAKPSVNLAQTSQTGSPFGQPSQLATSAFGKPGASGGFAQSGFGQTSQPATGAFQQASQPANNGFGQPSQASISGFGQQTGTTSFGQPSQPASNGFGQPSQLAATSFGPGTSFAGNPSNPSPFLQPMSATPKDSFAPASSSTSLPAFGASSTVLTDNIPISNLQTDRTANPLTGQPTAPLHYTETLPMRNVKFRPGTKDVISYAEGRVQYINDAPCYRRPDGKGWERIWFPEPGGGLDVLTLHAQGNREDLEGPAEDYTDSVKQAYVHLFTKGSFGHGGMPTVPPLREWCRFDF